MIDVEVRNATKRFGAVLAVDDISFKVRKGEFLTLLGPSGCGKTTTLRLIAGLDRLTKGEVLIRQQDVTYAPPYARDISLMFQNYALFPHKNVFDNIAFGLKYRERGISKDERKSRVHEALELVRLPGIEERFPRQLSGGQQQRVALARALVIEPTVLLLDEPFSNLDLKLREEMRVELKQIQEQVKISFVFVTHDQEEALMLSDRVAVMEEGRIIQLDTPRAVYETPQTRFVAEFIGRSNFLSGRVIGSGPSGVEFETESGMTVLVAEDHQLSSATSGVLQVRAERVLVFSDSPPQTATNIFSGLIERAIYFGINVQYFIRLVGGELLIAIRPTTGEAPLAQGTDVWVTFDPENCQLIRGSE